jgi:hypothetical protein
LFAECSAGAGDLDDRGILTSVISTTAGLLPVLVPVLLALAFT